MSTQMYYINQGCCDYFSIVMITLFESNFKTNNYKYFQYLIIIIVNNRLLSVVQLTNDIVIRYEVMISDFKNLQIIITTIYKNSAVNVYSILH